MLMTGATDLKSIGRRIKSYREYKRMTQRQVADAVFMSRANYGKYEAGEVDISITMITDLARVLDCSVTDLIGDTDPDHAHDDSPVEAQFRDLPPQMREVAASVIQSLHDQWLRNQTTHAPKAE